MTAQNNLLLECLQCSVQCSFICCFHDKNRFYVILNRVEIYFISKSWWGKHANVFLNIEVFFWSCNFDFLRWISLDSKPTCCKHKNLHLTFTNMLGFLLNLSTPWTICVNEQWPKKSLFQQIWHNVRICVSRSKKDAKIYLTTWNHDRSLSPWRTQKVEYAFSFWWTI